MLRRRVRLCKKNNHVGVKQSGLSLQEVGDTIKVFVRAVSPQSRRFMITADKRVKKMKELNKPEKEAN